MNWLNRLATGRKALAAIIVYFTFAVVLFNWSTYPALQQLTAGKGVLDERPGYTAGEAQELFDQLGEEGRAAYRQFLLLDLVNPLLLFIALALLWLWMIRRLGGLDSWLRWLTLVPLALCLADLVENGLILAALGRYPARSETLIAAASPITQVKLVLAFIALATTLLGLVAVVVQAVLGRKRAVSARKLDGPGESVGS